MFLQLSMHFSHLCILRPSLAWLAIRVSHKASAACTTRTPALHPSGGHPSGGIPQLIRHIGTRSGSC